LLENLAIEEPVQPSSRSGFVQDAAIVFGAWTLLNLISYAIHFILSRLLGISEYGAFASIIAALAIFGIPAAIVTLVVVKFVAEFHALGELGKIRAFSLRVMAASGALAAVLVLLGIAFSAPVAAYLHLSSRADVIAAAFALGIGLLLPPVRGVLQGSQDFAAFAISISIDAVARIGLAVAMVAAGYGVAGAFAAYAVAGLLSLGYTLGAVRRHWSKEESPLVIDKRRLLVTMGGAVAGTAAITFMGYIDVALVKHLFTPPEAGIYSAASFCGKILFFVVGFVPLLILPKAAQRSIAGQPTGIVLLQGVAWTAVLALAGLAIFYVTPVAVVRMTYGNAFVGAAPYLFAYGAAMSLLGVTNVVVTYRIGLHRFAFVWPLLTAAAAEPLAIAFFHQTLWTVVNVILAINLAALLLCLTGIAKGRTSEPAVLEDSETELGYRVSA